MNYTEKQIREMTQQLMKDIQRPYFEQMPFDIKFVEDEFIFDTQQIISNCWISIVYVQEDQFPDKEEYAIIIIKINDDTGVIENYVDTSCGRPVPLKAVLKDGKYELKAL